MVEDIKVALNPTLALIKQLNSEIKNNKVDPDTLTKLAATMKFSSIKLEKVVKDNKLSSTGGVHIPKEEMVEED